MTLSGTITAVLPIQNGTSKAGKEWRKQECVLTYDNSHPEYPKAVVFSVMNDNIEKFAFRVGGEYDIEVDFATREYQGKYYLSASCWKSTAKNPMSYPAPQQAAQTAQQPQGDDSDLPF